MNKTQTEKLEQNMAKWSKAQAKNHGTPVQAICLPCDCSKCRQRPLTVEEADAVYAALDAAAAHEASWAGLE